MQSTAGREGREGKGEWKKQRDNKEIGVKQDIRGGEGKGGQKG